VNKTSWILFFLLAVLALSACGGQTSGATTHAVDSALYTQQEIEGAIQTVQAEFRRDWKGCKLLEIYYAGDDSSLEHQDWATRHDADHAIVLLSSFEVDSSGGDGSLNPNSTYEGWNWILVRDAGGAWRHVDHGY